MVYFSTILSVVASDNEACAETIFVGIAQFLEQGGCNFNCWFTIIYCSRGQQLVYQVALWHTNRWRDSIEQYR